MKTVLAVTIVTMLVLAPALSAKDRRGPAVVLTTKAGEEVRGELYAVKRDAFVIADARGDMTMVPAGDVARIQLKKRVGRSSKKGAIIGGAVCLGFIAASIAGNTDSAGAPQGDEIAAIAGLTAISAGIGALIGWATAGRGTKTVEIAGLSGADLERTMAKLRKRTRVPSLI